jgi:hypothetical protein
MSDSGIILYIAIIIILKLMRGHVALDTGKVSTFFHIKKES